MKKNRYIGYKVVSNIIKFVGNIWFGGKAYGKENIPSKGRCILAGNHLSDLDAYMLYKGTKRPIHILSKIELFKGKMAWFFKMMLCIPVDRQNKNPKAKNEVKKILESEEVVAIFPEGTYHKDELLLPFKPGVISFAEKNNAPIIPFAMKNNCKFRSKPKIVFGKPIYVDKIKAKDKVKYLEDIIRKMIVDLEKDI